MLQHITVNIIASETADCVLLFMSFLPAEFWRKQAFKNKALLISLEPACLKGPSVMKNETQSVRDFKTQEFGKKSAANQNIIVF